ncbi:MAG: DUF3750 domain-containing protein [Kofleriaceae bacterium]
MPRSRPAVAVLGALVVAGCALAPRRLIVPPSDEATVLLVTGGLPPPIEQVARHPWFAVRRAGERQWRTFEVGGPSVLASPFANHPYVEPVLHGVWRGADAEAGIACLEAEAPRWLAALRYRFYPGPNSNTFADVMLRRCGLHASLPSTSIGKDWRGWFGIGVTSEGTGVQVETPLFGLKLGLKEGVEVHLLGLSFGIDLWPPAIIVPFGSGRIGFADR